MTAFLICVGVIIIALELSMVYSLGQLSREYRRKLRRLAEHQAMMETDLESLKREVTLWIHPEPEEDEEWTESEPSE